MVKIGERSWLKYCILDNETNYKLLDDDKIVSSKDEY